MSTTWYFELAHTGFQKHRSLWDGIQVQRGNHVLLDSSFIQLLLKHFGHRDVFVGVLDGHPAGMALIHKSRVGVWETFQPAQAPIGLALVDDVQWGQEVLLSLLRAVPGLAVQLSVLHQDPYYPGFGPVNSIPLIQQSDYIKTARIALSGSFDSYWQSREGRLRKNNDRLRRRMSEKGLAPEFVVIREPANVAGAISEYGRLESKGWKSQQGTAVSEKNDQGRFYRDLLETFCERGEGSIFQLRINGQVVASDLCLNRGETMVLLKTAYDEEWSAYSPAFLMREDVMRYLFASGEITSYEFYGPLMDYQLRWTDQVRTLYHLTCFRHAWVRSAKNLVKRLRAS